MRISLGFALVLAVAVAAPTKAGITVNRAKNVNFDSFSTYSWVESTEPQAETDESMREAYAMIRAAIEQELVQRGLREVSDNPHLLIRSDFVIREENRTDVNILDDDALRWQSSSTHGGQQGEVVREIDMGTLVVDLLDGHSKLQIWRATATAVVRPQASKKSEKRITKVVGKMFESYPAD